MLFHIRIGYFGSLVILPFLLGRIANNHLQKIGELFEVHSYLKNTLLWRNFLLLVEAIYSVFGAQKKEIWGERIPLFDSPCRVDIPFWFSIYKDRIGDYSDTFIDNGYPRFTKCHLFHNFCQEPPFNFVICLAHIQL